MLQNLQCQLHKMSVIKGCTRLECDKKIFLCDQCVREHPHDADDINDFSQKIGDYLKDTFQKQKLEWVKFCFNEQNKQFIQLLLKENNIKKWINKKVEEFQKQIKEKRDDYIRILDEILQEIERKEIDIFKQSAKKYIQKFDEINKAYEHTFRYSQDFYHFQSPFVFWNKILSEDNPEEYIQSIKQLKEINQQQLGDLRYQIQEFSQIKSLKVLEFQQILPLKKIQEILKQYDAKESQFEGTISEINNDGPVRKPPESQTKKQKLGQLEDCQNNNSKQQKISSIVLENIRYEEQKPSLLPQLGVKHMIFLSADLIIFGTNEKLFSFKNSFQQQIPLQFDYITCLDKLDNNSFVVGGLTKQGESMICKYYKNQLDLFQSVIIQKVQGDILTMIAMSKESISFIITDKQSNKEIKQSLYHSKQLGMPTQYAIKQDIGQGKKKKMKTYYISDNQFCLHLINEYISLIQINEKLKIFQELRKIECTMNGSVIPLINEQYLFSTCTDEEKMNNIIIDLNEKVKVLTGEYVWQTKSNIFDNIISILQITEKGKLFLALIDKYALPLAIQNQQYLGQLDIQLEQTSNYNLLVHFIEDQLYIKDEKTDSIKLYRIVMK